MIFARLCVAIVAALILFAVLCRYAPEREEAVPMNPCAHDGCGLPALPLWQRGDAGQDIRRWLGLGPDACLCDACWRAALWIYNRRMQQKSKGC